MRKETKSIAMACGISAYIGAMLTLAVSFQFGWGWYPLPFGAIISGFLGYLLYDIKKVGQTIRRSWREVIGWRLEDWERVGLIMAVALTCGEIFATIFAFVSGCILLPFAQIIYYCGTGNTPDIADNVWVMFISSAVGAVFGLIIGVLMFRESVSPTDVKNGAEAVKYINPVVLPLIIVFYLSKYFLKFVRWIIRHLPSGVRATWEAVLLFGSFFQDVFLQIHCEERWLCMVDTALGATIGFVFGYYYVSVMLGSLVGGVIGLVFAPLHYEIVSIRILNIKAVSS